MGRQTVRLNERINAPLNAACCVALCMLGASLSHSARAQITTDLLSSLPRASLLAPVDTPLVRGPSTEKPSGLERARGPLSLSLGAPASAAPLLMQQPQDQIPGQYTRPKYAVGFQSTSMRRWAKDFGLDADTCFAPIVRARTRLSQDGGLSGSLMMQARCSFY